MAEVSGRIGSEEVELHNAATEATLRLLLQSSLSANKQSIDNITKLATKAGLDPAAVAAANTNLKSVGETSKTTQGAFFKVGVGAGVVEQGFKKVDAAISPLVSALIDGTGKASSMFAAMQGLPGVFGTLATVATRLAGFQEKSLETYQSLTQSGVNFNGSLTQMRQAASDSYLTLDQFAKVLKANSATFANLGGNVNTGAMAFSKLSNSLLKSEAGESLRNLGYTTEEVNNGLASYLAASGGRNKQEMQQTDKITQGAAAYMTQLQGLADLTGQNREELDKEMKERAKNAAWEAQLAQMTPEQKDKALAGMANALAIGGKGAADAFQSKVMGVPPITKEAQMFTATMGKTNESVMRSAKNVTDSSKSLDDQSKESLKTARGSQEDMKKFSLSTQFALGAQNSEYAKQLDSGQKTATRMSKLTDKEFLDTVNQAAKTKALKESEAAGAVKTQQAVQEMGQTIMSALLPVIQLLTPAISGIVRFFGLVTEKLVQFKEVTSAVVLALGAYLVSQKIQNVLEKAKEAKAGGGRGGAGGILDALKGPGALGASPTNAMWVRIVGGGPGGISEDILDKTKGKSSGKMGALKKIGGGVGGLLGGVALDYAGQKLTESGHPVAGAAAGVGSSALTGASMGMMLGPMGAAVGGLLGAAYGAYQNKDALFGSAPKLADGAIVTKPTMVKAGEAGPEAIMPLSHLETLRTELQTLNKQTVEMLKYLKETAEYTRRTVDATKSLGGDMFKF